jgi:uncharacterized protein YndB with AHSA1/START domain
VSSDAVVAVVERVLPAPPEAVYAQWTDPAAFRVWMCPRPARVVDISLDLRVGGRLRLDIEEEDRTFQVLGEYLVLDRPHRLVFTWWCSTWPVDSPSTVVDVSLLSREPGETLLVLRHERLPGPLFDQHLTGWQAIVEQLERHLVDAR